MSNIFLNLNLEIQDFSNPENETYTETIKSFCYFVEDFKENDLEILYNKILSIKGDWTGLTYNNFEDSYYCDINIIFHNPILTENEKSIIEKSKDTCITFFNNKSAKTISNESNSLEKLSYLFNEEIIIIDIQKGGWMKVIDIEKTSKSLKDIGLNIKSINKFETCADIGASGGFESLMYFFGGAISSGITYDIIKSSINKATNISKESIKIFKLNDRQFNKIKNTIAERIGEDSKNLILERFENTGEEIKLIFKTLSKKIDIVCDLDYNILKIDTKLIPHS